MNTRRISALCLAAIAASAFAGSPGLAAAQGQVRVQVKDLDLNTPAGVKTLYRRLQVGSAQACGTASPQNLQRYLVWKKCYTRTLEDTVAELDRPELVVLHRQQGQHPHG